MELWIWLTVVVLALLLEFTTPIALTSVWVAVGGIAAIIAQVCGGDIMLQMALFVVVTTVAIILTRPLSKKLTSFKKTPTNTDRYIGQMGTVTQIVDSDTGLFLVKALDDNWSAVTEDGSVPKVGDKVRVKKIQGVKLIVEQIEMKAEV